MVYKKLIQRRIATIKKKTPQFRYGELAESLGIEASYLSRFINDQKVNFSDELLFSLLIALGMSRIQIEQVITLRDLEQASNPLRKKFLEERLQSVRVSEMTNEVLRLKNEVANLLAQFKEPITTGSEELKPNPP